MDEWPEANGAKPDDWFLVAKKTTAPLNIPVGSYFVPIMIPIVPPATRETITGVFFVGPHAKGHAEMYAAWLAGRSHEPSSSSELSDL
jgi:hypothetical protein